jgi:restriction system protein
MAVPDFQTLMLPLLELAGDDQQHTSAEAVESLAQRFQLSTDDRGQLLQNGQPRFYNRVGWATMYLAAVSQIAPVRNEIAHVREIDPERLLRASVACADVLDALKGSQVGKRCHEWLKT